MTTRIQRDIAEIKNMILQMSALVEESVRTAILTCQRQDEDLAKRVIDRDWEIDKIEVDIDSLVLKTLALQQPMAADLRFLTSAMQIAEQLERVGDHAVNIAEQVAGLIEKSDEIPVYSSSLNEMANVAIDMLGESINAFVYGDSEMARDVRTRDQEVDDLYADVVHKEIAEMESGTSNVRTSVYHIILALNIERIADLATNIAEDVIFLVEGRLIRHGEEVDLGRSSGEEPGEAERERCPKTDHSFRREPLECLENHARHVHDCLSKAAEAVMAYIDGDMERFEKLVVDVSELEHAADLVKRNVRAHLPRGIIMPIDKFELFLYLNEQDAIADTAEDVLEWITYRRSGFTQEFKEGLEGLMEKCLDISKSLAPILHAARTYFQTGDEDVRVHVKDGIRGLRGKEHDADFLEHELKKHIFDSEQDSLSVFYQVRLVELVGLSADHAESAADILRSMIAR